MGQKLDSRPATYIALSLAVLFWGLSFVATKVALESIPVFSLVFARFAVGSLIFMLILIPFGLPRFSGKAHFKLFFMAFFEPGLYFIFETMGLQYTTAAKASLIIALIPAVVLLFAVLFLHEFSSRRMFIGIILSFLGIAVLLGKDLDRDGIWGGHLFGDLLVLGAVLSASVYIISARNLRQSHSAVEITFMQTLYGALFYLPGFMWELPGIQWTAVSARSLGAYIYLTIFATLGAFLCYNFALAKVPASRAAVFINGIPVVTAVSAWLILGEKLTLLQGGGGFLVLLGVYLANRPVRGIAEVKG